LSDFRQAMAETLCAELQPRHIIMVGRDLALASLLSEAAGGATLHIAVTNPGAPMRDMQRRIGDRVVIHDAPPADAIALLPAPELSWIDADPNWHATHAILLALAGQAERLGKAFPLTIVQNTGWPYGRRDGYEDPGAIEEPFRHPHERAGLLPGQAAPAGAAGLFADRYNGTEENQPRRGVLTAVEDFLATRTSALRLVSLPGFGGLAAICSRIGRGAEAFTGAALEKHLRGIAEALEQTRLDQAIALEERNAEVKRSASLAATLRAALNDRHAAFERGNSATGITHDAVRHGVVITLQALRNLAAAAVPLPDPVARLRALLQPAKAQWHLLLGRVAPASPPDEVPAADIARLKASPAFDADWYLATYKDVAAAGLDPVLHYIRSGAADLRDPGPFFSTAYYIATYPDVVQAGLNPLLHYLIDGGAEGRQPGPAFDAKRYVADHPEIAATDINPLEHFLLRKSKEAVLF
jgi:hypothetical protein